MELKWIVSKKGGLLKQKDTQHDLSVKGTGVKEEIPRIIELTCQDVKIQV